MAITRRPTATDPKTIEAFIAGAPDSDHRESSTLALGRRRKEGISLTVDPALLARVDHHAMRLGISRAAAIALAMSRFVDGEERVTP